jgi:uncharacterized membrane protein YeaQ/YmgE (transglycosylase-associated protein family)
MMGIIAWIVIGALAGWIASMIMNTNEEQGAVGNIVVGIVGAFLGGWILDLLTGDSHTGGFNFGTLLTAILGSVILLAIVKAVRGPRHTATRV